MLAGTARTAPNGDEIADGELVRRVRRGDEIAFETLYHRYHRRITAYIHGMVHDHARAEDVAQDVFVSALRRMRETDRPIAFKPWIYEIAKNACIDQFRRSRRAEEVSFDADEGMGAADYGRLVSSEAMPETELESKQSLDHLRGAFGGLSETHHEILVMRELEGLSYREIGERLGMSRPSVESTLFRARRRLTEEYEELVSGARCQRIQGIIAAAQAVSPGARDARRLARHVSHCQPCRRQARLAGLEVPSATDRPVRQRIAALLPLPLFLRQRWSGDAVEASPGLSQWAHLGTSMDPGWLKAAATAVTVVVAGGLAGGPDRAVSRVAGLGSGLPGIERGGSGASDARATAPRPRLTVATPGATPAPDRTVPGLRGAASRPAPAAVAPADDSAAGTDTVAVRVAGAEQPAADGTAPAVEVPHAGPASAAPVVGSLPAAVDPEVTPRAPTAPAVVSAPAASAPASAGAAPEVAPPAADAASALPGG